MVWLTTTFESMKDKKFVTVGRKFNPGYQSFGT